MQWAEFHGCHPKFSSKSLTAWKAESLFRKLLVAGPILRNCCDSVRRIERLRHARLNWLGSLSRHLLSERAKLLVLRRKHVELLAHLRGGQFDKLRRGLHTQQLMGVVKGGASIGTRNVDQLEICLLYTSDAADE